MKVTRIEPISIDPVFFENFFEDEDMTIVEATKSKGISLPPKDRWGEPVPGEGTHCSNCEYLADAEKMLCSNKGFIAWGGPDKKAGSNKIPAEKPENYCSIWWEHE